jgi:dienelactone hydrolase
MGLGIQLGATLALDAAGPAQRTLTPLDPWAARLARDGFVVPQAGLAEVPAADGKPRQWRPVQLDAQGRLVDGSVSAGGWLYVPVQSLRAQTVLLHARGNVSAWLNGSLRTGDIYGDGRLRLPVHLNKGLNHLVLRGGRGDVTLTFLPAPTTPVVLADDATLPDLFERQAASVLLAGVVLMNPLPRWSDPLEVVTRLGDGGQRRSSVPPLPPLSLRKVALEFDAPALALRGGVASLPLQVSVLDGAGRALAQQVFTLPVKELADARRITFRSAIDDSVQYYGLRLADSSPGWGPQRPGLIVAQHGANVEAADLAASFAAKPWAHVVTPTNRHRFGFNWEEWGRLDLLEVLDHATRTLAPDPDRIWLMGHSMGGHGTWINGTLLADRFAAIAPVAGWATIWSYSSAPRPGTTQPVEALLRRAGNVADAPELLSNLNGRGVFVLHPGDDESVPTSEARALVKRLAEGHRDFAFHERPGAIHWWGNTAVDWPPLLDFLQQRRRLAPAEQRRIEFVTPDPGVSARLGWVSVVQQRQPLAFSRVQASADGDARRLVLTTDNVQTLALDVAPLLAGWAQGGVATGKELVVEVDGQTLRRDATDTGTLWLRRAQAAVAQPSGQAGGAEQAPWQIGQAPAAAEKGPQRHGRFQDAFRHGMLFVVGTGGTADENRWALEKARFDAELFAYRGNGGVQVMRDTDWRADTHAGRNLVLYGNADTHKLWPLLLADSPIQVHRGELQAGPQTLRGDDLAALFVRPLPGSTDRSIGVVATTGPRGGLVAERLPCFVPGLGFADWLIATPAVFERGWAGVRGTGFFDNTWRWSPADSAFNAP